MLYVTSETSENRIMIEHITRRFISGIIIIIVIIIVTIFIIVIAIIYITIIITVSLS